MDLTIEIDATADGLTILTVKGGIDLYAAPRLRECLTNLMQHGRLGLAADLSQVKFLGIAGRQVLADVRDQLSADGGFLWLISPPRSSAFPCELSSVFTTVASPAEARQRFSDMDKGRGRGESGSGAAARDE